MTIKATTTAELDGIIDEIHDHSFSLSDVLGQYGSPRRIEFREHIGFLKPIVSEKFEILTINNIKGFECKDTESIDSYPLNIIKYSNGKLELVSAIPLHLVFFVSALSIELEIPD